MVGARRIPTVSATVREKKEKEAVAVIFARARARSASAGLVIPFESCQLIDAIPRFAYGQILYILVDVVRICSICVRDSTCSL